MLRFRWETGFKETEVGEIPRDWDARRINEIDSSEEAVQTGPFGSMLHAHDYSVTGVPLLLVKNIVDGQITQEMPKVNFEKAEKLKKFWLKEGDIVFTRVGAVGRTTYIKKEYEGWMFSGQTLRLRLKNKDVNNRFIEYYFRSPFFKEFSTTTALGTTRPSINTTILENTPVPIPPKIEQDRIVDILSSLDDKIQLNHRMNAILERIGHAVFRQWFVDFEPFKNGQCADGELGKMPKGWSITELQEAIRFLYGKGLPENKRKGGSFPVVGSSGIVGYHSKNLASAPSIVVGRKGNAGSVYLMLEPSFPIDTVFYSADDTPLEMIFYMYHFLQIAYLEDIGLSDTAVPGLSIHTLNSIKVLVPSQLVLEKFCRIVEPLLKKADPVAVKSERYSFAFACFWQVEGGGNLAWPRSPKITWWSNQP